MQKIQAYLDENTSTLLADYAKKNSCSLSHAAGSIITNQLTMANNNPDSNTVHIPVTPPIHSGSTRPSIPFLSAH